MNDSDQFRIWHVDHCPACGYDRDVDRRDVLEFARRDWARVADAKTDVWLRHKRASSPADLLAMTDQLRLYAKAMRPDWPSAEERAADLVVHQRVGEALRATSRRLR